MSSVSYEEGRWVEPASGRAFGYRCWRPSSTHALLVIVHGFGEHGGRYDAFARELAARGLCVAAPDLWGHGRSAGRRGDIERVPDYVRYAAAMTQDVLMPASGCDRYALFGHSFGGLLAILWALSASQRPERLVLQSPLLGVGFPIPQWKTIAAQWVERCWPMCPFSMNLDLTALSHDPDVIRAYRRDPLVHNAMSARTYWSTLRVRDEAFAHASDLQAPVLMMCGTADRIIAIAAARLWLSRVRCHKRRVLFPGAYHELHHEPVRQDVARLTSEWVLGAGSG